MLQNIVDFDIRKIIENLLYEFDALLTGYQALRKNVVEKRIPSPEKMACSTSEFDNLIRNFQLLLENTCEKDLLNLVKNYDTLRSKYIEKDDECERLQAAYHTATQDISVMDLKLKEVSEDRDVMNKAFEELKKILLDDSFHDLPTKIKHKITSAIHSVQSFQILKKDSPCKKNEIIFNENKTKGFQNDELPCSYQESSPEKQTSDLFSFVCLKEEPPEMLIPDNIEDFEDTTDPINEELNDFVSGDVQVITVTWDQMMNDSKKEIRRVKRRKKKSKSRISLANEWFACEICKRQFTKKSNLNRHERLHINGKAHSCTICKKTFASTGDVKRHQFIHTNEKPYNCSICGKGFNQHGSRTRHMKIHDDIREFVCYYCNKAYTSKWALKNHIVLRLCPLMDSVKQNKNQRG